MQRLEGWKLHFRRANQHVCLQIRTGTGRPCLLTQAAHWAHTTSPALHRCSRMQRSCLPGRGEGRRGEGRGGMLLVNCSAGLALGNVRSTHSKAVWVGCAGTQKQKYQTPACTSLPNFCCSPHQQQRLPGACMWQTCSRAKFRICPLSLLNYAKIKLTRLP